MRSGPRLAALLALAALGGLALLLWPRGAPNRVKPTTQPSLVGEDGTIGSSGLRLQPLAAELSASLLRPEGPPEDELAAVGQLLYFYRQAFGENPVGDNADIAAALSGANAKAAAWLDPDGPALVDGRLVDRWGSPYWFHALGAREMEIRSAGPDRELFTDDDLALP
jgi:hypothetical protein